MHAYPSIRLDPDSESEITTDVHRYIDREVEEISLAKGYTKTLKAHVRETLRTRSEGTFLWVGFADAILRKTGREMTEVCLNDLPTGLDAMYSRILSGISKQHASLVGSILMWVTLAVTPLTLEQIGTALKLKSTANLSLEVVTADKIKLCGGLVLVVDDFVVLIHQSVKDYLLSSNVDHENVSRWYSVNVDKGHCEIAKSCLWYLQDMDPSKEDFDREMQSRFLSHDGQAHTASKETFLRYSVSNWLSHAHRSQFFAQECYDLFAELFSSPRSVGSRWLNNYRDFTWTPAWGALKEAMRDVPSSPGGPFVVAASLGLSELAMRLYPRHRLRDRLKMSKPMYMAVGLCAATCAGDERLLRFLLDKKICANSKINRDRSTLHIASMGNKDTCVKVSLESGANASAVDEYGLTPLHNAVKSGASRTLLMRLIAAGADVFVNDVFGRSPLHEAAAFGNSDTVKLLLNNGADVHRSDKEARTRIY